MLVASDGEKLEATSDGDGMIDAACAAIRQATGVEATLVGFNVSSVTGGIDASGDVVVQLESDGLRVSGRGVSTDVVEASARAYTAAVSRLERVRLETPSGGSSPAPEGSSTSGHPRFLGGVPGVPG